MFCLIGSLGGGGGLIVLGGILEGAGRTLLFCTGAGGWGTGCLAGAGAATGGGGPSWLVFLTSKEGFGTLGLLITLPTTWFPTPAGLLSCRRPGGWASAPGLRGLAGGGCPLAVPGGPGPAPRGLGGPRARGLGGPGPAAAGRSSLFRVRLGGGGCEG